MKWYNLFQWPTSSAKKYPELEPFDDKFYGLTNFGNTCYCNSVLQALYYCKAFREKVLEPRTVASNPCSNDSESLITVSPENETPLSVSEVGTPMSMRKIFVNETRTPLSPVSTSNIPIGNSKTNNLMDATHDLFVKIQNQKNKVGSLSPKKFLQVLQQENELFKNSLQHDAHEFLNYVLNAIHDILKEDSFIGDLFQGTLSSETVCTCCESISTRDELFLDLSVDVVEQHSSLTFCLNQFSESEILNHRNKFYCDCCKSLQEAEKRVKIKKAPNVLIVHLKRFKYLEQIQRLTKISHRISFPTELRLMNMTDNNDDRLYFLFAVIVHIGSGMAQGHYVTLVRVENQWICFDDDLVQPVPDFYLNHVFGSSAESSVSETAYILFYQVDNK